MKDERKGVSKKELLEKAKNNAELMEFIKDVSKEELAMFKGMRELQDIQPDTHTWKVAVLGDSVRSDVRILKMTITQRLNAARELQNNIVRLSVQLESGSIQEELKSGMKMNADELRALINRNKALQHGELVACLPHLAKLRALVGMYDVARQVVFTLTEFDTYVEDVVQQMRALGYDPYEELNVKNQ